MSNRDILSLNQRRAAAADIISRDNFDVLLDGQYFWANKPTHSCVEGRQGRAGRGEWNRCIQPRETRTSAAALPKWDAAQRSSAGVQMIECIFTIDYEIYGDGAGSLRDLVYDPAERLREIFQDSGAKFVVFVEAAEFEKIAAFKTDSAISKVEEQIRDFYDDGHEIALHLHPQWCNATYENGKWELDYSEYNLCPLS